MNDTIFSATYIVKGMIGTSCEARIERILGNMIGLVRVKASFSDGTLTMVFDNNSINEFTVKHELEKAGYQIELVSKMQGPSVAAPALSEESTASHQQSLTRITLRVTGMTCAGCETKVERILLRLNGVKEAKADLNDNSVTIAYDSKDIDTESMAAALGKAGYLMDTNKVARRSSGKDARAGDVKKKFSINQLIGLVIVLFAAYFIIEKTIGFNFIPQVNQSMGLGVLFLVGLLTSIHCVAMCGGINMSQCVSNAVDGNKAMGKLKPSFLYNAGRVISYTIVGGIVGAVSSVVSFSGWARGIVAVLSGLFIVVMGISMLGIFPWINKLVPRMPKFLQSKSGEAKRGKGPFIVGLLNGLMPCGPLQAMQLYALGTGSFLAGALSMLIFSLGTVPLMFGLGALSSLLSSKFTSRMMKVSAVLVLLLGLVMVNRGLALSGVSVIPSGQPVRASGASGAVIEKTAVGDVQNITSKLTSGGYPEITVQKGVKVRWNLQADAKDVNGCNRTLIIPKFGKQVDLKAGDNIIEFTPTEEGIIPYSCWMGMITSRINVVADAGKAELKGTDSPAATPGTVLPGAGGGCCASASLALKFAGGKIPVDDIQIAKIVDGVQEVTITVSDQGYSPAAAVVQKGIKTKIKFVAEKLNSCNSTVVFPEYNGALDLSAGQLETPALTPDQDFTFECSMSMLHGYVKVVDDINKIDTAKIKEEISQYKPATTGGGCCG